MPYGIKDVFGFCAATTLALAMLTPAHGAQEETTDPYTVDNIPAGEAFIHKGPVVVKGDVGAKAVIKITDGGLHVKGDVEEGAHLSVKDADVSVSGGSSVIVTNGSVTISGNGNVVAGGNIRNSKIIINGKVIEGNNLQVNTGPSGLKIDGTTGNNVTLDSTSGIEIKKAGEHLTAVAGNAFEGKSLGDWARVNAGNRIEFQTTGSHAGLEAGNSVEGKRMGLA